jgi:hypothetical protein
MKGGEIVLLPVILRLALGHEDYWQAKIGGGRSQKEVGEWEYLLAFSLVCLF